MHHLHIYRLASAYFFTFRFEDDKAVGLAHRLEDAGALCAGGTHAPYAVVLEQDAAVELGAAFAFFQRLDAARGQTGQGNRMNANVVNP